MSSFIPTRKNNPCPVCGDTKGKCRTIADSTMVLCMTNLGIGKGAIISNYYCTGDSENELWAKFIPEQEWFDFKEHWTQEQRTEWIQQQERLKQQRLQEKNQRRASSLPVEERDLLYRQLLAELTLHPIDQADLLRRGYSEQDIKNDNYKSVEKWQRLSREYDNRLPGVDLSGRSLNVPYPGYLCAVTDENGYIAGFQIRNRNPNAKNDGEPKYPWLTSKTKKRPLGPQPNLYPEGCGTRGELPLKVIKGKSKEIALIEGTGPKPFLASDRLGVTVIGAAGGMWASSPVTLKSTLDKLRGDGPKEVTLYPDGGDVSNRHTMVRDRKLYNLLTSWGYTVKVAWWGQTIKGKDIDNLTPEELQTIRTITWDEFWAIACSKLPSLAEEQLKNQFPRLESKTISRDEFIRKYGLPQTIEDIKGYVKKHAFKLSKRHGQLPEQITLSPEQSNTAIAPRTPEYCPQLRQDIEQLFQHNCHWQPYVNYLPNLADPYKPHQHQPQSWKLAYRPGHLPTWEQWKAIGEPIVVFKGGDRKQLYIEAASKGYPILLDRSLPGYGKSHTAGTLIAEDFGAQSLTYFDKNHRNVSTSTIEENFKDVLVRHPGMKYDPTHLTPNGARHCHRIKPGETPDVLANCLHGRKFEILANKGINTEPGDQNPMCQNCQFLEDCKQGRGDGFGFFYERSKSLSNASEFRAHPKSLLSLPDGNGQGEGKVAIIEESNQLLTPVEEIEINITDIERTIINLIKNAPPLITAALQPFLLALQDLLEQDNSYHGLSSQEIIHRLPVLELPIIDRQPLSDSTSVICNIQMRYPTLIREIESFIKDYITSQTSNFYTKSDDQVREIAANWLVPFLKIYQRTLSNLKADRGDRHEVYAAIETEQTSGMSGAFRIANKKLIITKRNYHTENLLKTAAFQIHLDATINRQELAKDLNVKDSHILTCCQNVSDDVFSNLTIKQIKGMGECGAQRSQQKNGKTVEARLPYLIKAIKAKHPNGKVGIIDLKRHKHNWIEQADVLGHWFNHNRGSNEFRNCDALIIVGMATPNIGAMASRWQAIAGQVVNPNDAESNPGFWSWVQRTKQKEMIQAVGRIRANLQPHKQIPIYIVTQENLEFLEQAYPGAKLEAIEAIQYSREAAPREQQTQLAILEAFAQLQKQGQKVTQQAIASIAGITQGRISQIAAEFQGWKCFQKLLVLLLESLNSETNNFDLDIPEELRWLAEVYLPAAVTDARVDSVAAVGEIFSLLESFGTKAFRQIMAITAIDVSSQLLVVMLQLLPGSIYSEIAAIYLEGAQLTASSP